MGLIAGIPIGGLLTLNTAQPNSVVIEKGCGLYYADNGNFAFIGECQE
jgi:hypothetical protein